MKKWKKILAAIVAVVVVLVVALAVLAKILITQENVRATLVPLAEKSLNRKVDLGDINVSLLSGIEINGLKIYEQNPDEVFISTDLIRLKYQLLPLLAMKVVIDEVRLESPKIRVERLKDGRFNFSDLLGADQDAKTASKESNTDSSGSPISLLVSTVAVTDGTLTFLDHALNDKSPYRYQLTALEVSANGVSLTGKLPVKITCQLNGSPLLVDGKISFVPFGGEFDVDLKDLDVVAFSPYLKDVLPGKLGGLKLSAQAAFSGIPEDLALKGSLALADLDFVPDALPEAALEDARIDVNYDLRLNQKSGQLHLEKLMLDYNGIQVTSAGDVNELFNTPELDLAVSVPALDIRQALHVVPKALTGDMGTLDPAGSVSVDARLSGKVEDALGLLKDATIRLDSVQATAGGYRPALSGTLKLVGDVLKSEQLYVRMGDNQADINLVASKLFAKTIRVKADVTSDHFDLDPLMKGGVGSAVATDQSPQNSAGQSSKEELGPFEIPLHATGTVKVAEAAWKGMMIKDFIAEYQLKDNILEFARIDGQVAGGSFSNNARVDLGKKGLAYSAQLGLHTIQADPLLTALSPKAAGSLMGALNLDMNLSGRGTQWETLSKKLNGQGDMLISDGRVINPGLVKGFAAFLQLPDTNEIAFKNFKGNIKVVDGKVKLDSSITSDQIKLFPKGDIGLDGILKMSLDTRLSPQLSARLDSKGSVSKYLTDQDGWSQLPLLVSGSYASPRFGLDPKGINEQAKKALSNELGRQLNKFLGGSDSASGQDSSEASDSKEPAPDPAGQLLQKLFGN